MLYSNWRLGQGASEIEGVGAIANAGHSELSEQRSVVSLLFAPGTRPHATAVAAHAEATGTFAVSHAPVDEAGNPVGWLELIAKGLTFDLVGLPPAMPQPLPARGHQFGLVDGPHLATCEAITIAPGRHLSIGKTMFPVVQCLAVLAASLADLPGLQAIAWHPARAWSDPAHFRSTVRRWSEGGVFPGLGLAALLPTGDGGLLSEGLDIFIGQELLLGPELVPDRAEGTKIALRLMHWLVENGKVVETASILGPSGEVLRLSHENHQQILKVTAAS